ncbi:hypothetical protein MD484_g3671, partial [Candolleomyces efflorescens]
MDYRSTSSRRSVDFPKPETDLAEWTSKIKALQRQVDADEENEQRRLEEEIAAARQARLRRSSRAGRPSSVDLSRVSEQLNAPSPSNDSSIDKPRDPAERHGYQNDALRKIMGQNSVYLPDTPAGGRSEGVSLASFIGGRASGPRLNKHAPQQNAHDPTQFNQPDLKASHPIFGKGGVAMPGMVSKKDLGGGVTKAREENQKAISDLKAVASALGTGNRTPSDSSRSSYLRQPDQERQKSTSPTPRSIVGTEAAERYRPSASPTPSSTLRSQKSFDRSSIRGYGTEDSERYRPSTSPTPTSTLKPQKSFDRGNNRSSEDAERFRPSTSPVPSPRGTLKPQKSFDRSANRSYGSEDSERYRPSTSPVPSPRDALKPQKSFDRGNNRSYGTEDAERYRPSTSPIPNPRDGLKPQKSFDRGTNRTSGTNEAERYRPLPSPTPRTTVKSQKSFERPSSVSFGTPNATGGERPSSPRKPVASIAAKSTPDFRDEGSWNRRQERSVSPQKTGNRERALSTPKPPVTDKVTVATPQSSSKPWTPSTPNTGRLTAPASNRERTISTPSYLPKHPVAAQPSRSPNIATNTLARPIQPEPRLPSSTPKISTSAVPSPAFQKTTSPKDVTPSISRLQGRGFVQNMVKVSHGLETKPTPSSTTASPAEKPQPSSLRKGSVLDRWPPATQGTTSPVSPVKSTFNTPVRRAVTADSQTPIRSAPTTPAVATFKPTTPSLKTATPLPKPTRPVSTFSTDDPPLTPRSTAQLMDKMKPAGGHLGSATTMFVEQSTVDELGVKRPASRGAGLMKPTDAQIQVGQQARPVSKTGVLAEQWKNVGPITPKPVLSPTFPPQNEAPRQPKQYSGIRQALPGMVKDPRNLEAVNRAMTPKKSFERPNSINIPAAPSHEGKKAPLASPSPQPRIPSSGSRATVMEVAQALTEHAASKDARSPTSPSQSGVEQWTSVVEKEKEETRSPVMRHALSPGASEKRKSSYDSFATLPPLKEEATPAPSPANTLSRSDARTVVPVQQHSTDIQEQPESKDSGVVRLVHDDAPLPRINLSVMLRPTPRASPIPIDAKPISVEVISIVGSNGATVTQDETTFYDSETLAIIHRCKSASNGLVDTFVWGWLGKHSQFGEVEEKKLHELSRRYGTTPVIVRQCAEPVYFVRLLGGRLSIRQGTRAHWTAENTTMHLVRAVDEIVFIDEHDLSVRNLCSAFSYCLSILGTIYVWYGTGSVTAERDAALAYATSIRGEADLVELTQGEDDDNEMFWMILGESPFADADYWRWRRTSSLDLNPSVWRVDASKRTNTLLPVEFLSNEANPCQSVYVVNCIWELFVVVGSSARGRRHDIRLALDIASTYAQQVSSERPYTPNVHVVIIPSQLPLDLKLHVRDMDETILNSGNIPDHMNVVSFDEASEQLSKNSWDRHELQDSAMLPLGLDTFIIAHS